MKNSIFNEVSMNGRMAYLVLCVEKYLTTLFPEKDWRVLSEWMWKVTSLYWDEWDDKFIEIIPEYLFEFDTYADSDFELLTEEDYEYFTHLFTNMPEDFNKLMINLHEMQKVYCYTSIPGIGSDSIRIIEKTCDILKSNNICEPDASIVLFSKFTEKDGWGEQFDGTHLSLILN